MGAHYSHAPVRIGVSSKKMVIPLWRFASDCYCRTGAAEICLHAQDEYAADVNMLLAAAWLAERGTRWESADVIALVGICAEWRTHCLLPLRSVRRYLKHKAGADEMYTRAKMLELEAEHQQLQLMESVLGELGESAAGSADILRHNLRAYLSTLPSSERIDAGFIARLADLIGAQSQ
jgi:uncharacterized protein (TIGR02444 family)